MNDDTHHDALDGASAQQRETALFADFGERLSAAAATCPGLRRHLDGCTLDRIATRADLAELPVLDKATLVAAQQAAPPLGGFARPGALQGQRLFLSPGPVCEPQLPGSDPWNAARALHAAGFRAGHVVHNAFGYHGTPGGFMLDEGARALGCTIVPAGTLDTDRQLDAIRQLQPSGFCGTPDFLNALLDKAGAGALPFERALLSGGALFPALRERFEGVGIRAQQCYATADLGVIAYESATDGVPDAGLAISEGLIVEICRPGSGTPVGAGEVGELVVTRLHPDYPLIRFATGDLSRWLDEAAQQGRTAARIAGWMGRADQRTKVRGQFIDPRQVQRVRAAHPQIEALRVLVRREGDRDVATLEIAGGGLPGGTGEGATGVLADVTESVRREIGLTLQVTIVDAVPNDGVVVRDLRDAPPA